MTPPTHTHKAIKNERTIGTGESGPILLRPIPSIPISDLEAIINYHEAHDDYAIATETLRVFIQMNVKERTKFISKHKNK